MEPIWIQEEILVKCYTTCIVKIKNKKTTVFKSRKEDSTNHKCRAIDMPSYATDRNMKARIYMHQVKIKVTQGITETIKKEENAKISKLDILLLVQTLIFLSNLTAIYHYY